MGRAWATARKFFGRRLSAGFSEQKDMKGLHVQEDMKGLLKVLVVFPT